MNAGVLAHKRLNHTYHAVWYPSCIFYHFLGTFYLQHHCFQSNFPDGPINTWRTHFHSSWAKEAVWIRYNGLYSVNCVRSAWWKYKFFRLPPSFWWKDFVASIFYMTQSISVLGKEAKSWFYHTLPLRYNLRYTVAVRYTEIRWRPPYICIYIYNKLYI